MGTDGRAPLHAGVYGPGYKAAQMGRDSIDAIRQHGGQGAFPRLEFTRAMTDGARAPLSVSASRTSRPTAASSATGGVGRDSEVCWRAEHIASLAYSDASPASPTAQPWASLESNRYSARGRKGKLAVCSWTWTASSR